MIDFIKAVNKSESVCSSLLNNRLLDFQREVNEDTGELSHKSYREALYKGVKFRVYDKGYSMVLGSIHKAFNAGKYNYNDFNYNNLIQVLEELECSLISDLSKWELQNLEIGLNIKPPVSASDTVKSLLVHRMKMFKYYSIANSEYKQAIHSNYYIKAYSKTIQYNLNDEVFRFEIKYRKMLQLKELGINVLNDLRNRWRLKLCMDLLFKEWQAVILYDPTIDESNLTDYNKSKKIWQWKNADRWINDLGKNQRNRELKKLEEITAKESQNIKKLIEEILRKKADELLNNCSPSNRYLKTGIVHLLTPCNIVLDRITDLPIITAHFDLEKLINSKPFVQRFNSELVPNEKSKKVHYKCSYFRNMIIEVAV